MVTPIPAADEHGLRGVSLDSRLRQLFFGMSPEKLSALARQVVDEATRRELVYFRDGKQETINVMLRPAGIFSEQLNYFHYVSLTLVGALKRMPELYLKDLISARWCRSTNSKRNGSGTHGEPAIINSTPSLAVWMRSSI